jgi:hypothetical protein
LIFDFDFDFLIFRLISRRDTPGLAAVAERQNAPDAFAHTFGNGASAFGNSDCGLTSTLHDSLSAVFDNYSAPI